MKVILTGPTGIVGSEVLAQCLTNPAITSLVVLSRTPVPVQTSASSSKVQVLILSEEDFLYYSEDVLQQLGDAEACIWCLDDTPLQDFIPDTKPLFTIDYLIEASAAFARVLASKLDKGIKFRFVFSSGKRTEAEPEGSLWFKEEERKVNGDDELAVLDVESQFSDTFKAVILRPGRVLSRGNMIPAISGNGVKVQHLAAVMIHSAIEGTGQTIIESSTVNSLGKTLLHKRKYVGLSDSIHRCSHCEL